HEEDDLEFNRFPRHCVKGSRGAGLIQELQGLANEEGTYKIYKSRYSSFHNTNLDDLLRELQPTEIHIVGVCTNICVLYTVEELCNRDYKTLVYKEGVASFDADAHLWAIKQMENVLGAKVI
ncbi:MAG TPA: isochorismatase family cysteine hydrolase, partial [Clostridia bacterium]|nr:isochorismatase family cysteine hydrolase [Clostridia bacterium]